jgi:GWxTD domain-containing protein
MRKPVFCIAIALLSVLSATWCAGATANWLDFVAPIISPAEKKVYLALSEQERTKFEEQFWSDKAITAKEYTDRAGYIDGKFGSSKPGSGVNTDQGRVYLALGPPNRVARIPSSRIFQPVEIWYYSVIPGVINTEVSVMFFQKNGTGYMKLYSPTRDTIRALLLPQASNVHLFGPNDDLNEAEIRNSLQVSPAEDEIVSASVNIAAGVRYEENDTIIGRISSPSYMLGKPLVTEVTSRLITSRPTLETLLTVSAFGGMQVDLKFETQAQREIGIEVLEGDAAVYQNQVRLRFSAAEPVIYTHRLDLLPGPHRVIVTVDGKPAYYSLDIPQQLQIGEIQRAGLGSDVSRRETPFEFDSRQLELNPNGAYAVVALPHPGRVTWMIRSGGEVLWRSYSEGQEIASIALPTGALHSGIAPGTYRLEALIGDNSTSTALVIGKDESKPSDATVVSFNANLSPARRFAFVGHQWLMRGKLDEARRSLQASLAKGVTDEARIELARAEVLAGNLDTARDQVRSVLAGQPNNFEALSVLAYIETRFQDYAVAARLYRQALEVQDSPAVRAALAQLPAAN